MIESTVSGMDATSARRFEDCQVVEMHVTDLVASLIPREENGSADEHAVATTIRAFVERILEGPATAAAIPMPVVHAETRLVMDGWLTVESYRRISPNDDTITVKVRLFEGTKAEAIAAVIDNEKRFARRHTQAERVAAMRSYYVEHPSTSKVCLARTFHLRDQVVKEAVDALAGGLGVPARVTRRNDSSYPATIKQPARRGPVGDPTVESLGLSRRELDQRIELAGNVHKRPDISADELAQLLEVPVTAVIETREWLAAGNTAGELTAWATGDDSRETARRLAQRVLPPLETLAELATTLAVHLGALVDPGTRRRMDIACRRILAELQPS